MRPKSAHHKISQLQTMGVFTLNEARKVGVPHSTLYRLLKDGAIQRIREGIYYSPDSDIDPAELDYIVACKKFGKSAAIGGLTALFHYNLIDQAPKKIWVVVPSDKKSNDKFYRCLRTQVSLKKGVDEFPRYRMTSIERTLVEALKYSTKIGIRTALNAIRSAIREKMTNEIKIGKMAAELKMKNILHRYWETIVP